MQAKGLIIASVIASSAIGCQTANGPGTSKFSWWKKTPKTEAIASATTPAAPALPSSGAAPAVSNPTLPEPTATASYPEQPAAAAMPYPSAYPTTATPAAYSNPSATATTPAAAGAMSPQTSPYSPVYGSPATSSTVGGGSGPAFPTTGYASTYTPTQPGVSVPTSNPATSTPIASPATVNNAYVSTGAPYPGATVGGYSTTPAETTSAAPTDGRYADPSSSPAPSEDRYSAAAPAAPPADRYQNNTAAADRYQPGNYTPGDTGYNPPGVPPYQSPVATASYPTTQRRDPYYRPGNTSDYRPADGVRPAAAGGTPVDRYAAPTSPVRPAAYGAAPYQPTAPASTPSAASPSYSGDRYSTQPTSRY